MVALDIAILPPPDVSRLAIELSAALPEGESQGLRLGAEALPHITLTQQFVPAEHLAGALDAVDAVLREQQPLRLAVSGGGRGRSSVWMRIEPTQALADLHARLMHRLESFESSGGGAQAFYQAVARPGDIVWVAEFRRVSSFAGFTPHITLGHASAPPVIQPMTFDATTIAACHLGRLCSCGRVFRQWTLAAAQPSSHLPAPPHPP